MQNGGFRFLKDHSFFASSRDLKKARTVMALLMVMTICLLVYAALGTASVRHSRPMPATVPNHKGQLVQHSTARWVFHDLCGIHLLLLPGSGPSYANRTEEHWQLLRPPWKPYERLYR